MKINELERNQKVGFMHHNSQSQVNMQHANSQSQANPAAYDDLKKRLLNEYKKLVSNKKSNGNGQPSSQGTSNNGGMSAQNNQAFIAAGQQIEDDRKMNRLIEGTMMGA